MGKWIINRQSIRPSIAPRTKYCPSTRIIMKKILISIIAIAIAVIGVMQWNPKTYSQSNKPTNCSEATTNEINLMRAGWSENLQSLLAQEKPASKMVEEAFEGLKTYRCWLNYLCETVLFSGIALPEDMQILEGRITRTQVGRLPGCSHIDQATIPGTELKYMPLCHISESVSGRFSVIQANKDSCIKQVGREFSDFSAKTDSAEDAENFKNHSSAFVGLEAALKQASAKQRNQTFNRKMQSLLNKMTGMHGNMVFLREQINTFDSSLPCYAAKCD